MSPQEQAFLSAICAEPADDSPRLVYADWLEERGLKGDAERAAFIRVQCELARIPRRLTVVVHTLHKSIARSKPFRISIYRAAGVRVGDLLDLVEDPFTSTVSVGPFRVEAIHLPSANDRWPSGAAVDLCSFPDANHQRRKLLQQQERTLATGEGYLARWATGTGGWAIGGVFERGFLSTVEARGNDWCQAADRILQLQPISDVILHDLPECKVFAPWSGFAEGIFSSDPRRLSIPFPSHGYSAGWGEPKTAGHLLRQRWRRVEFWMCSRSIVLSSQANRFLSATEWALALQPSADALTLL